MILTVFSIFVLAAVLGAYLISFILGNKNTPKGVAIIHGATAALGIILLIIISVIYPIKPYISLILFILAALGGFTMMYRDITGKSLPKWLALGHGLLAVVALILLWFLFFWTH